MCFVLVKVTINKFITTFEEVMGVVKGGKLCAPSGAKLKKAPNK
jgi:hypothetical protein